MIGSIEELGKLREEKEEDYIKHIEDFFKENLNGKNSSVQVSSRSIAQNNSKQDFTSNIIGNNECFGHVECDAIIKDNAKVTSTPKVIANSKDATLIHEAAIGKIANDQITKLMTLGLSKEGIYCYLFREIELIISSFSIKY